MNQYFDHFLHLVFLTEFIPRHFMDSSPTHIIKNVVFFISM